MADGAVGKTPELEPTSELSHANEDVQDEAADAVQAFELVLLVPKQQFVQLSNDHQHADNDKDDFLELPLPSQLTDPVHELKQIITESPEGFWLGSFGLRPVVAQQLSPSKTDNDSTQQDDQVKWGPWTGLTPSEDQQPVAGSINSNAWRLTNEGVLGDYADLSAVFGGSDFDITQRRGLRVVPTAFSALAMNQHLIRVRDTLSSQLASLPSHGSYDPSSVAIAGGSTVFATVRGEATGEPKPEDEVDGKGKGTDKGRESTFTESNHPFVDLHTSEIKPDTLYSYLKPSVSTLTSSPCLKSLGVSPWSPPPHIRRLRGDLVYLTVSTLEGEAFHVTGAVSGFWISKMTANTFDPSPRAVMPNKMQARPYRSLFELLAALSPSFSKALSTLLQSQQHAGNPDVYLTLPITHHFPPAPWLVHAPQHSADPFRTQLAYLLTNSTSADVLPAARDWNDEYAQYKELPQTSVAERLMRERLQSRVKADFVAAATKTTMSIARGDIPPLNPNEATEAHTWVHNNMLFTRAEDAIGAYSHVGGNEASRHAASKDLAGVDMLERLDVDGVHSMATAVIDYAGERWVVQSLIPGLFKTKDDEPVSPESLPESDVEGKRAAEQAIANDKPFPSEVTANKEDYPPAGSFRIVYGSAVPESPDDKVRSSAYFHQLAQKVAKQMRFAEHKVVDANGAETKLWTSTDMHGIAAPDGRSYFIDCFRMHCVDVEWLENSINGPISSEQAAESTEANGAHKAASYPHRLTFLREELLNSYHEAQLKTWLEKQVQETRERVEKETKVAEAASIESELKEAAEDPKPADDNNAGDQKVPTSVINAQDFVLLFNPDAFVERKPSTEGGKAVTIYDAEEQSSKNVRAASKYLRETALTSFVSEVVASGNTITDGFLLSKLMHRKGINMRYLGALIDKIDSEGGKIEPRREVLKEQADEALRTLKLIIQLEMVIRSSKHILNSLLRSADSYDLPFVIAHFLNCLLGSSFQSKPVAEVPELGSDAPTLERNWTALTPESLRSQIVSESEARFRYTLPTTIFTNALVHRKVLRELCTRVGVQLVARSYQFARAEAGESTEGDKKELPVAPTPVANGNKKKKGKAAKVAEAQTAKAVELPPMTFKADDVLNIAPVIKSGTAKSSLADESFELAQRSFNQGAIDLASEQAQDALQMCEQVLGSVHPEASLKYHDLAILYHQLSNSLARKLQYHAAAQQALQANDISDEDKDKYSGLVIEDAEAVRAQQEAYTLSAVRMARQGVIIAERTLGLDAPETIQQYTDLGLLEQLVGNSDAGMRYTKHAMLLWANAYGADTVALLNLLNSAITMVQSSFSQMSIVPLLEEASQLAQRLFGDDSIAYSSAQQAIGQVLATNQELEKSLPYLKNSLAVMEKNMPAESKDVVETKLLIEVIANQISREGAEQQAREDRLKRKFPKLMGDNNLRARMSSGSRVKSANEADATTVDATGAAAVAAGVPKQKAHGQKADLPLDELVDYIQGKSSGKGSGAKARKRKTSPPS
ncbi:Intracellular distribution of mitochondria [Microbotryomycetes sp. JL221]|nr:Intracellular distribution of mitochondria [Microbotryomycetes sp. JL221]